MSAVAASRQVLTMRERTAAVATALKRLGDEHGLPRKFSSSQVGEYSGLSPIAVGLLVADPSAENLLRQDCRRLGIAFERRGRCIAVATLT